MTGPALSKRLVAELDRIAVVDRLLIALDFDGTLAPEVDDPEAARALPTTIEPLHSLSRMRGTTIAFVSGRSLASLDRVVPPGIAASLIGSHGLEVRLAQGDEVPAVTESDSRRVTSLRAILAPLVEDVEGAWIEDKPAGFAVHTRLVEPGRARTLQGDVRLLAMAHDPQVTVRDGKNVLEFAVRDATKGDGLRALRQYLQPDAVLFAGDDVTDEDALAVLEPRDIGIKVGTAPTVATHRVADPAWVAAVLERLSETRQSLS